MGKDTKIEWCDSTCNPQMGCDGCELWSSKTGGTCYAATLINRYAGASKGYPESFDKPQIFPGRIEAACKWPDLTGAARPDKPWLDGFPRLIFLDDLGDTFTESLPRDWLLPYIDQMEASPHIWQFLTKRPGRMRLFFERLGRVPRNFWLMTSVTSQANASRIRELLKIKGASVYGVSYEPILGRVDFSPYLKHLDWIIAGGESGKGARALSLDLLRRLKAATTKTDVPLFVKQLGKEAVMHKQDASSSIELGGTWFGLGGALTSGVIQFADKKGGNPEEWPKDLRIREMPR